MVRRTVPKMCGAMDGGAQTHMDVLVAVLGTARLTMAAHQNNQAANLYSAAYFKHHLASSPPLREGIQCFGVAFKFEDFTYLGVDLALGV